MNGVKEEAKKIPQSPGVYIFRDKDGNILYVGKAKNLKKRVTSYFRAKHADPKLDIMVPKIKKIETYRTENELEALVLESRLIKELSPRYNSMGTDDKSGAMVAITGYDDFPKLWVVRETDDVQGEKIGPFQSAYELKKVLRVLQRIFKFATCNLTIREGDMKRRFFRPCLLHYIKRCSAPCAARITKEKYHEDLGSLRKILETGSVGALVRELEEKMNELAAGMDFEKAAEVRDQINALKNIEYQMAADVPEVEKVTPLDPMDCVRDLQEILKIEFLPRRVEAVDIAHVQGAAMVGSVVTFVDGIPFKNGYRRYKIKTVNQIDDFACLKEVMTRRYVRIVNEKKESADVILVDGGVGQLNAVAEALKATVANPPLLLSLAKREEILFRHPECKPVECDRNRPGFRMLQYARDEAHRFAQLYHHLLRRKSQLPNSNSQM